MPKLKLQMQISLDGYVTPGKGAANFNWDAEVRNYCLENTKGVESILLGRNTANDFIPYWASVAANPADPNIEFGKRLTEIPKIVFSRKLKNSKWNNSRLAKGNIVEEINKLKKQKGKDMLVYGGSSFVSTLLKHKLVDDVYLLLNPVALSDGLTIFKQRTNLKLVNATTFSCGTVVLHYQPL
jgi:dihydrofolate reductase